MGEFSETIDISSLHANRLTKWADNFEWVFILSFQFSVFSVQRSVSSKSYEAGVFPEL
jgi:hypothetical protein